MEPVTQSILAVSWSMPPAVLPQSIQISRLLGAMSGQGCEIHVLTSLIDKKQYPTFISDDALAARYADKFRTSIVIPDYGAKIRRKLRRSKAPLWEEAVCKHAASLLKKTPHTALITFAQPFSDHLIGLRLKRDFPRLPWIAHFSDPWADNPYATPTADDHKHERETIELADALVFTTERTKKLVMRKYPEAWATRAHVLAHCLEPDDIAPPHALHAIEGDEPDLHILHTGNLYDARAPYGLLFALLRLKKKGMGGIKVSFVGHAQPAFLAMLKACALEDSIFCQASLPPVECNVLCAKADVLLVCDAPAPESVFLPSKLVDYLAAGRPILALTPQQSSTTDFLRDVGGFSAPPEDVEAIATTLENLLRMKRQGTLETLCPTPVAQHMYLAETAADRLLGIIASLNNGGMCT
ncbi:MAG: hypothetical protein FWG17_01575 [Desulfovibrionaceae bacterium]|nr:hypothetical protein [Desulfovibrionaceae bacterium]